MLTAILRSNTIVAFALSYLLAAAMIVVPFLTGPERYSGVDLLYSHWAFSWLQVNAFALPVICISLISAIAILSRLRARETKVVLGNSNLVMVSVTAMIMVQPKVAFSRPDVLMAALIILGMFLILLSTYKRESVLSEVFHIGLMLGVASLFTGQSIFLVLSVAFSLLILRSGNWREWAVLGLGVVMTVVFILMVVIWYESPSLAFQRVVQSSWLGEFTFGSLNAGQITILALVLISTPSILGGLTAGTVIERNISMSNFGWAIGIAMMVLLLGLGWRNGIILAAFPLSTFLIRTLEPIKRWWIADLILLALLAAPFVSSLWQL